jgi:beta-lactamase class A
MVRARLNSDRDFIMKMQRARSRTRIWNSLILAGITGCAILAFGVVIPLHGQKHQDPNGPILIKRDGPSHSIESPARATVEKLITESGAEVGLAFRMLDGSQELYLNEDTAFHAASTMKVGVMYALFEVVKSGNARMEEAWGIKNEFRSIVDGSTYQLDAKDDSYAEIYQDIGQSWTLRHLCEVMITKSSNLAANLLIERLGVERITQILQSNGVADLRVLRGVEDGKAFRAGKNNTTTAYALGVLLSHIASRRDEYAVEMQEILKRQKFNEAIPAGLPSGISVGHKTGEITGIHHDAAIVFAPRPFVLVILVKGIEDKGKSSALMAAITKAIYEAAPK